MADLQAEYQRLELSNEQKQRQSIVPPPVVITNLKNAALGAGASVHDILSAMKEILVSRCPDRPYNGLKKALASVAESPGKV